MGRERPTCAKLHAPLTFACYRGAPTAHEVSILWFIASVVAAANFFRGLLADPGPNEASLFLRGVVVLLFLTDAIVYLVRYRRAKRASEE